MNLKNEDYSTQRRVLSIYWEAVGKLSTTYALPQIVMSDDETENRLRRILLKNCVGVRQTPDARIARRALTAAAFERINESK